MSRPRVVGDMIVGCTPEWWAEIESRVAADRVRRASEPATRWDVRPHRPTSTGELREDEQ